MVTKLGMGYLEAGLMLHRHKFNAHYVECTAQRYKTRIVTYVEVDVGLAILDVDAGGEPDSRPGGTRDSVEWREGIR